MKTRSKWAVVAIALVGLLVPACIRTCESTTSDGVLTAGLRGDFRASAGPGGDTAVIGRLRVGGQLSNVYLELVGDDELTVTRGSETEKMIRRAEAFGMVGYHATLDGDSAGQDIRMSFSRKVDRGAPGSTVRMPSAFELTSPASGAVQGHGARGADSIGKDRSRLRPGGLRDRRAGQGGLHQLGAVTR
jgi:hypothetical protein